MSGLYNVGVYVRLSVENTKYRLASEYFESESVENQAEMLSKFICMMPGWVEKKTYIDNGYSGATFDRPAFLEMMEDVRSGVVNLVLVKDLSRFGRNYLEAGKYLEEELPAFGCRFVSLSEGIDTADGENDIMAFLNAMNDYYLKNLSDRIRSVMVAKARDGQKISGNAPYGYRRNPDEPTRLIVDDYSAGIVRRIFEMRKHGDGYGRIAKALNEERILPPLIYYLTENGRDTSHIKLRLWQNATVQAMLRKELYIGNAIQLVKTIVSHRDKREVCRSPDERVRVDNAFPPIIDRDTWDAVQAVNAVSAERYKKRRAPETQLFSGILFCADCGRTMIHIKDTRWSKRNGSTGHVNYLCQAYQMTGGMGCTRHTIGESPLKKIVGSEIQRLADQVGLDEAAVLRMLTSRLIGDASASKAKRKREQQFLQKDLHKLEVLMARLYEDRVMGKLPEDEYSELACKNEADRIEKEKRLALLEQSEQDIAAKKSDIQAWIRLIKKNSAFEEVSRDLLESLVERIEIGEHMAADGTKCREVRIVYKFIGLAINECSNSV